MKLASMVRRTVYFCNCLLVIHDNRTQLKRFFYCFIVTVQKPLFRKGFVKQTPAFRKQNPSPKVIFMDFVRICEGTE